MDQETYEEIAEKLMKKAEELREVIRQKSEEVIKIQGELEKANELISYMNNKDRMARDNAELLRRVRTLKARFMDTAAAMETAIKLSIEPCRDDLSKVVLPEPIPALLNTRYLG
jgi:predicted nuclease with TOPRIM domain